MSPIILVGAGVLLLGLGLGLGYWFARIREATRTIDIQSELDNYRRQVTEHFGETAQHFQMLGQQYQSLYRHMAQGADALCDPAQSDTLLGFAAGNAPAIMASNDQPENPAEVISDGGVAEEIEPPEVIKDYAAAEEIDPPEVIKDYAAAEEVEPQPVEAEIETATPPEPLESSPESDYETTESPAEEVIEDQVAAADPVETERTVH